LVHHYTGLFFDNLPVSDLCVFRPEVHEVPISGANRLAAALIFLYGASPELNLFPAAPELWPG